jgi:hypothetical protein
VDKLLLETSNIFNLFKTTILSPMLSILFDCNSNSINVFEDGINEFTSKTVIKFSLRYIRDNLPFLGKNGKNFNLFSEAFNSVKFFKLFKFGIFDILFLLISSNSV